MPLVVDAAVVVSALTESGPQGVWAESLLCSDTLVAPYLMQAEAANILRPAIRTGEISAGVASLAHAEMLALPVQLYPYYPLADRIWELQDNVTTYDAWYVALAEALDAPLATLDGRLARAPGPRCRFTTFDG